MYSNHEIETEQCYFCVATPTLINAFRTISEPAPASSTPKVKPEAHRSRHIPISIPIDPITTLVEDEVESRHSLRSAVITRAV